MSGRLQIACAVGAVAWLLAGCSHTKVPSDPPAEQASREESRPKPKPKPKPSDDSSGPPLSVSPADALAPGGIEKIQAKLVDAGDLDSSAASGKLDAATKRALREFQKQHKLPATGNPDDATVQALGIEPGAVFRSQAP